VTYFFTVVTHDRAPILCTDLARPLLHAAFDACRGVCPFDMPAVVLLPDHLHAIWTLPPGDEDFAGRWAQIKGDFTRAYLAAGGVERVVTAGQNRQRRRGVWQPRFWEHLIRDENDYERHFDYVHWNPVKHGHAATAWEWPWSSFRRWVTAGEYPRDWGCGPDRFAGVEAGE
jgi:putative transposase